MKKDLITTIVAGVIGVAVAFFVVSNIFMKDPTPVSVKIISTTIDPKLGDPNIEIFNYRAVNPTVEAYVDCTNYDYAGNCIEQGQEQTVEPEDEDEEDEEPDIQTWEEEE